MREMNITINQSYEGCMIEITIIQTISMIGTYDILLDVKKAEYAVTSEFIKKLENEYNPDIINIKQGENVWRHELVNVESVLEFCKKLNRTDINVILNYRNLEKFIEK